MLYTTDAKGKIRTWDVEVSGSKYRFITGLLDGKKTESGWTQAQPKNVGKSNATTAEQQAFAEALAEQEKKLKENYSTTVAGASTKAFIEPMLAHKYEQKSLTKEDFDDGVSIQPKLDGMRSLIRGASLEDYCKSRNGRDIVSVPHITRELSLIPSMFDGELYNHDLKADFNKIMSLVKKTKPTDEDLKESEAMVKYHIYDIVMDGDFTRRSSFLSSYFNEFVFDHCVLVPTYTVTSHDDICKYLQEFLEAGYEGAIIRKDKGLYEHKRSKNLLKFKEFQDEEFTVVDIQEGLGNWAGKAKRVVCLDEKNNIEFETGVKGNFAFTEYLLKNKDKYIGKPVTVRYFNRTPDNVPRFGVAYTFWPDGVKE